MEKLERDRQREREGEESQGDLRSWLLANKNFSFARKQNFEIAKVTKRNVLKNIYMPLAMKL